MSDMSEYELGDEELRQVADEALEWEARGNYVNAPLASDSPPIYAYMGSQAHSYYTGVIVERRRSRSLAMKLVNALLRNADAVHVAADVPGHKALLDECRAAGLLPSDKE